jgi:hypothetical protein
MGGKADKKGLFRLKVYEKQRTDRVYSMSRFKQVWLSFWRKNQGLGMIEAAITLPLFLMITFGVVEFGNMYMARYQARDVASSVGDYLQGNPSASSADLQTFVTNLGFGSLKNTGPDQENNVFAKIKIQSEKTMLTAAQFDTLCSGGGVKNWANRCLGGDPADDKNDYYIHICYPYTYNTITPLSDLTAGTIAETKTMNSKALAYITKECPAGQALTSAGVCVVTIPSGAVVAFYLTACPAGWNAANGSAGTPDLRGTFVRGYDPAGVRDPDGTTRAVGSQQNMSIQSHVHWGGAFHRHAPSPHYPRAEQNQSGRPEDYSYFGDTGSAGGAETRPHNVSLLYCVKS